MFKNKPCQGKHRPLPGHMACQAEPRIRISTSLCFIGQVPWGSPTHLYMAALREPGTLNYTGMEASASEILAKIDGMTSHL